jgi:hypothetical protein
LKSPKSISDIISKNPNANRLNAYQQQTSKFRQIHDLLSNLLGDTIAENISVSNFKNSILYLETSLPAIAAGFKMKHSEALSLLRREYNPATVTIEIKVNPKLTQTSTKLNSPKSDPKVSLKTKTIPESAAQMLVDIANSASGELKEKLQRLAKHAERKNIKN